VHQASDLPARKAAKSVKKYTKTRPGQDLGNRDHQLRELVKSVWDDEQEDYQAQGAPADHIFTDPKVARAYLANHTKPAP
jgi:hypothetical protein